jgi:hypothetical protein
MNMSIGNGEAYLCSLKSIICRNPKACLPGGRGVIDFCFAGLAGRV